MALLLTESLQLSLVFCNELERIKILASNPNVDVRVSVMGMVSGKEQLLNLLAEANADHYIFFNGDILAAQPQAVAVARNPQGVVEDLEATFQREHNIRMKLLNGETLTDDEWEFTVPQSVQVWSSSVPVMDGLECVHRLLSADQTPQAATSGR
jgi:hypothetical protein